MNNLRKMSILTVIAFATIWLSACNLSNKSKLDIGKMRVREQYVTKAFDLYRFNDNAAAMIVNEVLKNNNTEVVMNVSYLKGDKANKNLMLREGRNIRRLLKSKGLASVRLEEVPVETNENTGKLVVYYKSKIALAPKGCTELLGHQGAGSVDEMDDYAVGCNSKMVFSKMIADPSDLLGEERYGQVESRRAGATVEQFKAGVANDPIQGMSASQLGN